MTIPAREPLGEIKLRYLAEAKPTTQVNVLLNFFDELRRRAPSGGK